MEQTGDQLFPQGFVWIEHGDFKPGAKVMSVYHAHGHMIGTNKVVLPELKTRLQRDGFQPIMIDDLTGGAVKKIAQIVNGNGYLFARQGNTGLLVIEQHGGPQLPSQFGQRNIHEIEADSNDDLWDWKKMNGCDEMGRIGVQRTLALVEKRHQ